MNARFFVLADPLLRILAALWIIREVRTWPARVTWIALVWATEGWIFWVVFERGGTYDPVTANLVRALGMAP